MCGRSWGVSRVCVLVGMLCVFPPSFFSPNGNRVLALGFEGVELLSLGVYNVFQFLCMWDGEDWFCIEVGSSFVQHRVVRI